MFMKKMKTRLFLLHSNQIGQPISSFREFSEDHKTLLEEHVFHMYLSKEKGNSAVQDKRRILYVPMKVN